MHFPQSTDYKSVIPDAESSLSRAGHEILLIVTHDTDTSHPHHALLEVTNISFSTSTNNHCTVLMRTD